MKAKVACHYLFSADDYRRQRNLLKTTKRSLKSFNCSCVIGRKYKDHRLKGRYKNTALKKRRFFKMFLKNIFILFINIKLEIIHGF